MRRFSTQGAPSMDILGNESLWQDESLMVEAAAAGTETTRAEDSDTVSSKRGARCSAEDVHCLELFGLGSGLAYGSPRGACSWSATRRLNVIEGVLPSSAGASHIFSGLPQAVLQEWRRSAKRERLEGVVQQETSARGSSFALAGDGQSEDQRDRVVQTTALTTPSDVLTASSVRMMLSMALAVRRSNPEVLQAICGSLLELLLETPPLVLAPLHRVPTSIEATTFRKVSDFCSELMRSSDHAEHEPALGLYLALAVSRGEVSCLLEAVRCLLDRYQQTCRDLPNNVGEKGTPLPSVDFMAMNAPNAPPGAVELEAGWSSKQRARVSAVLDRLANHRVDLHLSFPDECNGMKFVVSSPARVARIRFSSGSVPPDFLVRDQTIDWDCPASAATDGGFVYAWHPDIGLLKAGVGLHGTTKGRLYAQNPEAGRPNAPLEARGRKEGFVAVIGNTLFLQAGGWMPPHRFLAVRKNDLAVIRSVDAMGLALPTTALEPSETRERARRSNNHPSGRNGDRKMEDALGEGIAESEAYVPLCCDGRLVYALVPVGATGRPSVLAVDLANTGRAARAAIELQLPSVKQKRMVISSRENQAGEFNPQTADATEENAQQASNSGGELSHSVNAGEWPWWQNGKGASPGVRTYSNGDRLVVCWPDEAGVPRSTDATASTWQSGVTRAGSRLGVNPSPQGSVATNGTTDVTRTTHMARFQLSTGACELVESSTPLPGTWSPSTPFMGYDLSNNLLMRCSLRPPPLSGRGHGEGPLGAKLHVHLWQNGGLAPGPLADGPFRWEGALRTLASDVEGARRDRPGHHQNSTPCIPAVPKTAVFVLSHLDRLGEHYSGWTGSKAREGGHGASPLSEEETLSVPFCFDLTPATFRHLIALVETFAMSVETGGVDDGGSAGTNLSQGLEMYVLCASLRLLNVNVGILLSRGLGVAEFGGEALRESLLRCLLGLVEEDRVDDAQAGYPSSAEKSPPDVQSGRKMAAREALRLLVDGMDLFYPTQPRQACLLCTYLLAFEANSGFHPPVAHALTMELLTRVSSLRFLRGLETNVNADMAPGASTEAECLVPGLVFSKYAPLSTEIVGDLSKALLAACTIQSVRDVRLALNKGAAGHTTAPVAENVWQGDTSIGCAGPLGLAILSALDAILKLRYSDAFRGTKSETDEGRDFTAAVPPRSRPLLEFTLLVLNAANDILDAAASAPTSTAPVAVLSDAVVDTLRHGLIGTLLPSCLASILALLEEDKEMEWCRAGAREPLLTAVEDRLVQVTRTMGLLATQGWACVGVEKEPECGAAIPEEDELVWRRVVLGAGTCGSEDPVNELSVESAKHYPKASCQDDSRVSSWLRPDDGTPRIETARGNAPLCNVPRGEALGERNGTICKTAPDSRAGAAWLVRLERLCVALGASVVRQLMMGAPQDSEEKDSAQCLRSPLLVYADIKSRDKTLGDWDSTAASRNSLTAQSSADTREQIDSELLHRQGSEGKGCAGASVLSSRFMAYLCSHPASRESRALSVVMRRVVLEDRGHDKGTNEAIWAAAVAAVHHAGLEEEVARIVREKLTKNDHAAAGAIDAKNGIPLTASPALIRAWRCVQQTRFRLEGGALRDRETALVRRRAQFLVSLKPWASAAHDGALQREPSEPRALTASELVLHFLLRTVERADAQVRGGSGGDGVRGDDAEPRITAREGDPDALLRTVEVQSVRAVARSRAFLLAAQLLNRRYSHRSTIDVLQSVADGLTLRCLGPALSSRTGNGIQATGGLPIVSGGRGGLENTSNTPTCHKGVDNEGLCDTGRLHFMVGVECCDARSKSTLVESVAKFLRQCFLVIGKRHITDRGAAAGMDGDRHAVVVQALRAVSMDYGVEDHGILHRSQLLPLISTLVDDAEASVSEAASVALQALGRCVLPEQTRNGGSAFLHQSAAGGLEGERGFRGFVRGGDDNSQPRTPSPRRGTRASCTPFQTAFFRAVRLKVQEISGTSGEKPATVQNTIRTSPPTPSEGRVLLEALHDLRSDQAGLVMPHFPLGTRHTLSLWVLIPTLMATTELGRNRDLGDCQVPSLPADRPQETLTSYVVVEQASCVVRRTPSLSSERIGVLNAGEVIEVLSPEPQWERHPLVLEGRRVRLTWPMKGYASLHTAEGSVILEPVSIPWRRRASDSDLSGNAEGVAPPCPFGGTSRRAREQEGRLLRTREFTPAFGGAVSGTPPQEEQETRAMSAEPPPRRSAGLMERGGSVDVTRSEAGTPSPKCSPFAGGILLFKGNEALLGDDEKECCWNRLGIEVTPAGALRFFVGEGGPSEAAVTSRDGVLFDAEGDAEGGDGNSNTIHGNALIAPGWYHVAVVQDQLDVALFVNGRRCGAGSLPQHLWRPSWLQDEKSAGGVEGARPNPNVCRTPSTTMQFDSGSRAQNGDDVVRFPADLTSTQEPSIDSHGREPHVCDDVSPWPIYLGQPPPHASWRRTIHGGSLARVRAWDRPLRAEEINDVAMDPPPQALRAAPVEATARLEGGSGSSRELDGDGKGNAEHAGGARKTATEKVAVAQILALAHGCCQLEFGRKEFSTVATVRALLSMVLVGEPEIRGWALRVCRETLPWLEPSVVDDQFRSIVQELNPSFQGSFVNTCLLLIGKISRVWGSLASISSDRAHAPAEGSVGASDRPPSGANPMLDMLMAPSGRRATCARVSAREAFSLSSELASLLHTLVEGTSTGVTNAGTSEDAPSIRSPAWEEELARVTREWLCRGGPLVESLQLKMVPREEQLCQESEMACKYSMVDQDCGVAGATEEKEQVRSEFLGESKAPEDDGALGTVSMDDLDGLVAVLCVLGGQFGGVHPGAKVLCRIPSRKNASDADSRRGSHAFGSQGRGDAPENATVEEATVLRLHLSCIQPQVADVSEIDNEYGVVEATEVSMRQGGVDGAVRRSVQEPRPVFSSRLVALPSPGGVRPLDVYDGLAEEAHSGVVPPATVAREPVGDNQARLLEQQWWRQQQRRQNQQQQDTPVRVPTAGPGSTFRGQGREWAGMRRRSSSPDIGEAVGVPSMASAHVRPPASAAASQQTSTGCGEWVTVGIAGEASRSAPHVATVPIESVTPVRMGTPSALTKALMPHVEEFLPGLRALLEGPTHTREQQEDQSCVVESAHPYEPGESRVWSVVMEGAKTIEVSFDPNSRVAQPGDQIMLSWRTPSGSGGHRSLCPCVHSGVGKGGCSADGDDGNQTWPGVGEEPPLVVVAEALNVRFVPASATPGVEEEKSGARVNAPRAWGFRFTAKGRKVQRKPPPSQSASLARAILCDLRARTVKSLAVLLENSEASSLLSPLVPVLAKVVLGASSQVSLVTGHAGVSSVVSPPAKLEQRLARAYALLHEQPRPPSRLPEEDLVVFSESGGQTSGSPTDDAGDFRASTVGDGHALASMLRPSPLRATSISGSTTRQGRVQEGERAPPLKGGTQHARSPTEGAWPRRYIVCVGGVEVFDSPARDERLASRAGRLRLRHGAKVLVVAQERDWLKLIYDPLAIFQPASAAATRSRTGGTDDRRPRSASPAHVWARQREDDTIFLAPEAVVDSEHVVAEASDAVGVTEGALVTMTSGESDEEYRDTWGAEDPMSRRRHDGAEWESSRHEEKREGKSRGNGARERAFANDSSQDLRGHAGDDLWGFTIDTLCAAASRFAVSALLTVAKRWRGGQGQLFSEHLFGSVECLWQLLRHTNAIEQGNLNSTAMCVLKQCMIRCVGGEGGAALGRSLVGHALDALRECATHPGPRAVACVLETTHPYQNKMDVEWNVHMSGASRIKVVFDPRSRTALDCDWLSIVQEPDGGSASQHVEKHSNSDRYHGRGGRENFPGFGGRAPLWLTGDRFVARFHSGLNTTDWGVRFTAYGFLDDRSGESRGSSHAQRAVSRASPNALDDGPEGEKAGGTAAGGARGVSRAPRCGDANTRAATTRHTRALDVELCCWLLEILSHEGRKVPELTACLCDKHALGVYQECLQVFSQRRQLRVLRLVTCVIAEARVPSTYRTLPQPLATAFPASDSPRDGNLAVRPSAADADAALEVILAQITTQQTIEGDPLTMSPYLQALVQCAARLYAFPGCVGESTDSRFADDSATKASRPATPERDTQVVRTVEVAPGVETCVLVSPERLRRSAVRLLRTGPSVDAVREVTAVWAALSDFFQGTTPTRMLLKEFLPVLTEAFSVTVQSTHPLDLLAQHRVIAVPGATGMLARFDHRTEMREDDKVVIRAPRRHATPGSPETAMQSRLVGPLASQPTKAATVVGNLLRDGDELSFFGLIGGTDEEGLPLVSVGDLVARGPDWAFGDEDAGAEQQFPTEDESSAPARVGVVIALEKWDKCDGAGARVRWGERTNAGAAGVVGEDQGPGKGFEALYSVQSPAHVRVVKRGGPDRARRPVIAAGDTLELDIVPAGSNQGPGGRNEPAEQASGGGSAGKRSHTQCIRFDGESTYVDLPRYRGMRLEGDFTLEVWAWLDPGAACDGKPKCVFSRALDQSLHQSRHASAGDSTVSEKGAKAAPPVVSGQAGGSCGPPGEKDETGAGPETRGDHPPGYSDTVRSAASAEVDAKEMCADLHSRSSKNGAPVSNRGATLTTPSVSAADGGAVPGGGVIVEGDCSPPQFEAGKNLGVGSSGADASAGAMASAGMDNGNANVQAGVEGKRTQVGGELVGDGERVSTAQSSFLNKQPRLPGGIHTSGDDDLTERGSVDEEELFLLDEDDEEEEEEEDEGEEEEDGGKPADENVEEQQGTAPARASGMVAPEGGSAGVAHSRTSEDASTSGQDSPPPGAVTSENVYIGMRVMRGHDWKYRQQDGGKSKAGTVVGIRRLDSSCPPDGDNPLHAGWTKVRWDNGRANSYETGARGKFAISFADAVPGAPRDLVASSATDRSISISWSPPARLGRPPLQSYIVYCDDVEIASVAGDTFKFTHTNRMRGWPYTYSVAARGAAGASPCCPPMAAVTATKDDRRTQLALWVGGQGEIQFAMGNERGKGVILGAGQCQEGVWTHLAVSMEGRKVSVFVDGDRRATGKFVGRRLCPGFLSPTPSNRSEQPSAEPLRLGSRGDHDFWRGQLCGMRVWGVASVSSDIRRKMGSIPSASLVRAPPPPSFKVTVPDTQEDFVRLRVDAPLPDPSGGAMEVLPGATKAYYEVTLRSGGCMQIGWALPSSYPSSCSLAVGDDECSWAVDGLRAMKWHGNTWPVSSPHAHGVPYGKSWKWGAGDVVGCAVDFGAGTMSFSHNGCNLGKAFVREQGRAIGRYRVIAPNGLKCRVGIDEGSAVVETFSPGTVLQVSQVENLLSGGTWRLRTAEGWVAERAVDDPDKFFLERLEQDTWEFTGAGPERCVFADGLRSPATATGEEGCKSRVPHALCKEIVLGECYAELVVNQEVDPGGRVKDEVVAATADSVLSSLPQLHGPPRREAEVEASLPGVGRSDSNFAVEHPLTCSLLANSVEVGDADAVTFSVELFVPAERTAATAIAGGIWGWGVVVGDLDVYLSTQRRFAVKESDNGGGHGTAEASGAPGDIGGVGREENKQGEPGAKSMHVVIEGPAGFIHALPVCSAFRGRWMTLKIVARRSGESVLVCTQNSDQVHAEHDQTTDTSTNARLGVVEPVSDSASVVDGGGQHQAQQRQLRCTFSNPRFFRGGRLGCIGLYSERTGPFCPENYVDFPFRARHAVVLLGSAEDTPPLTFPRLLELERLMSVEHERRLVEPPAWPQLIVARRLRRIWSGGVPAYVCRTSNTVDGGPSTTARDSGVPAPPRPISSGSSGTGLPTATSSCTAPDAGRALSPTLTVWQALLSPGRVAFGSAVHFSRFGTGTAASLAGGDGVLVGDGAVQRRCVTAWEHPALQTPARFEAVPLPPSMSSQAVAGRGLWAWAPVPRSEAFLAMGLVFTAGPEPPPVTGVRCVLKHLVKDAEAQKCKRVTLQRSTKRRGQSQEVNSNADQDSYCNEILIVKEMGVCVPKEGSAWGLSPRVVVGDAGERHGMHQPRWDGLMPTFSGTAGESVVINLGHSPFRHPIDGYLPVSEVVHADARLVLQVYKESERMWRDVQHSHGLLDLRVPPRAPDLVGSWMLGTDSALVNSGDGRYLENDVFSNVASSSSAHNGGDRVSMTRLSPARACGVQKASPSGPPAPPLQWVQKVWGVSVRVIPQFPSELSSAHPWLRKRFEEFTALVWGDQPKAHALNTQLVRYVNAVASRRGLSKDELLSCDWSTIQPSHADIADWPLLESLSQPGRMAARRVEGASPVCRAAWATPPLKPTAPPLCGGVEESKESGEPPCSADVARAAKVDDGWDEWVLAAPNSVGGVELLDEPLDTAKVIGHLPPGHMARLLPREKVDSASERFQKYPDKPAWRHVHCVGGEGGWLALPPEHDSEGSAPKLALERFRAYRCMLDGFSPNATTAAAGDTDSASTAGIDNFWLPMRQRGSVVAPGTSSRATGPSPLSAACLQGDSDALLLSAVDAGAPSEGADGGPRPLLVTGKWKIGLVTDTLTVTTRTSGCTRIVTSPLAEHDASATLGALDGAGKEGTSESVEPLPVLVDGLVFGFRAVDGLLIVSRALPKAGGSAMARGSGAIHMESVERRAVGYLGGVDEGTEVAFSIVDTGEVVLFSCREIGGRRRVATVRSKCGDTWGRGRVAFGLRAAFQDSANGWVRVVSKAHGATVRSGMRIDADGIVGRIPCGSVVPFDSAIIYHSPVMPGHVTINPVVRYSCIATATTPAGWISERGRYADHPYRICEQVRARPQQPAHLLSEVSVACVGVPPLVGAGTKAEGCDPISSVGFAPAQQIPRNSGGGDHSGESAWQRSLNELSVLSARFHLLQQLNRAVVQAVRYVNLSQGDLPWSIAGMLSSCRQLIFLPLKQELWQAELARTARPLPPPAGAGRIRPILELRLSRGRASRHARPRGSLADLEQGHTLFGQAFLALKNAPAEAFRLRPGEALYSTVFLGEHAHDAGGPYRESFAEYCAELQSGALPVLIRCPNAVSDVGINREKWLPNPAVGREGSSAVPHGEMLLFLGRLMGVAIRSQQPLDLDMPSIVWKQLVRSPITRHDLEAIDWSFTQSMSWIRSIHHIGDMTEEVFKEMGLGGFEVATADGGRAELPTPGGASRKVTLENRLEFADMAEAFKMREFWEPVEVIRRGIGAVIPVQLLRLFSWDDLEMFVCGQEGVDIDLLEACTEYNLCSREDKHVSAFWDVLRSFSQKEKSLFLRFAWGRSRLPMSAEQFHQPFKIQAFPKVPADAYLPVAHTCFFSLELPRYSSREILEAKLRYAIHNCLAIDADDTSVGRNAAGMGWGEEP